MVVRPAVGDMTLPEPSVWEFQLATAKAVSHLTGRDQIWWDALIFAHFLTHPIPNLTYPVPTLHQNRPTLHQITRGSLPCPPPDRTTKSDPPTLELPYTT